MIKKVLNYIIYDSIECGTYGKVYKAHNLLTDELCAVKTHFDIGTIEILRREYMLLSKLQHKNIIKLDNYFEQVENNKKRGYLIMELGDRDLFEDIGITIDLNQYLNYILDIINGLEYLHSKNIMHGDIKLENILLVGGIAKIVDFGLSKLLRYSTKPSNLIGTKGLIAPEISIYGFCCLKSDIWSLGKLMKNIEIEFEREKYNYPSLEEIIRKCLEINYKLRPNITELKNMFIERYQMYLNL